MRNPRNTLWKDELGLLRVRWVVIGCCGGLIAVILAVAFFAYHVDKSACYAYGERASREVRFTRYNLVTWDCLTPTREGRWISTDQLREVDR